MRTTTTKVIVSQSETQKHVVFQMATSDGAVAAVEGQHQLFRIHNTGMYTWTLSGALPPSFRQFDLNRCILCSVSFQPRLLTVAVFSFGQGSKLNKFTTAPSGSFNRQYHADTAIILGPIDISMHLPGRHRWQPVIGFGISYLNGTWQLVNPLHAAYRMVQIVMDRISHKMKDVDYQTVDVQAVAAYEYS